MWPNPQKTADLVTFTQEILNRELHFFYSDSSYVANTTSIKLSPTRAMASFCFFLSIILDALAAFLIDVKSNKAISESPLDSFLNSSGGSWWSVAKLTADKVKSTNFVLSILDFDNKSLGSLESWNENEKDFSWNFSIPEHYANLVSMILKSILSGKQNFNSTISLCYPPLPLWHRYNRFC